MKIPVVICGILGRMGKSIVLEINKSDRFTLVAGVARAPFKEQGWALCNNLDEALLPFGRADEKPVVIDFSGAECAYENLAIAARHGCSFLLGTTGHQDKIHGALKEVACAIAVAYIPNTSLMANLLMHFCRLAALSLTDVDISIIDLHHKEKKDAPSGTALALAKAINAGGQSINQTAIHSLRQGQVIGEHSVYFFNDLERLELTHRVADRQVFAQGALLAAQFLFRRAPGLYDMNDVLNLNKL